MLDKIRDAFYHVGRWAFVYVVLKDICNLFKVVVLVHVCQCYEAMAVRSAISLKFVSKRTCNGESCVSPETFVVVSQVVRAAAGPARVPLVVELTISVAVRAM